MHPREKLHLALKQTFHRRRLLTAPVALAQFRPF
jgi:hypothetical protein